MSYSYRKQKDRVTAWHHGAWDLSITWGSAELTWHLLGGSTLGKTVPENGRELVGWGKSPQSHCDLLIIGLCGDSTQSRWVSLLLAKLRVSLPCPLLLCLARSDPVYFPGLSQACLRWLFPTFMNLCVCKHMVCTPQHACGSQMCQSLLSA